MSYNFEQVAQLAPLWTFSPWPEVNGKKQLADARKRLRRGNPRHRGMSSAELLAAEAVAADPEVDSAANEAEESGLDDQVGGGFKPERDPKTGRIQRLKGKGKGARNALIAFGSLGLLLILAIVLLLFLASALKIPNFAAHLADYNLTRVGREFADSANEQTAEAFLVNGENEGRIAALQSTFGDIRSATWGKLDKYRPQKVIDNMKADGDLKFTYDVKPRSILPGDKMELTGLKIGEETVPSADLQFGRYFSNLGNKIQFQNDLEAALEKALPDTPNIVRTRVARQIQSELGVQLNWWQNAAAKFKGKNEQDAFAEQQVEAHQKTSTGVTQESAIGDVAAEAEQIANEEAATLADGTNPALDLAKADAVMTTEAGTDSVAADAATSAFSTFRKEVGNIFHDSLAESVLNILNPVQKIALPICIVYDGSLTKGHGDKLINNKSAQLQRAFYGVESAGDQQKFGDTNAEAVGAMNDKMGDVSSTIVERRANGEAVATNSYVTAPETPQTGALGQYNVLQALAGDNGVTSIMGLFLDKACPVVLSREFLVGGAALGIISLLAGPETEAGADAAAGAATETVSGIVTDAVQKSVGEKVKEAAIRIGAETVAIGTITVAAKLLVMNYAGTQQDGLSVGKDFATQADMGGNLQGNELDRKTVYGRPMQGQEVVQSRVEDIAYRDRQQTTKSAYDRYFALTNANSAINKLGLKVLANFGGGTRSTSSLLTHMVGSFGNAFVSPNIVSTLMGNSRVLAASANYNQNGDYGIIQWGWSPDEANLIHNDATYGSLYNATWVYHHPDLISKVENDYGKCYTETMGQLLTDGSIKRDNTGKIIGGDCAPANLSVSNQKYGDAVFRWRLSKRNDNVLQHLLDIQDASGGTAQASPAQTGMYIKYPNPLNGTKNMMAEWKNIIQLGWQNS